MYTCIPTLLYISLTILPNSSHLGCHRALSWTPCTIQLVPSSYLFYTWKCKYVKVNLPIHPTSLFHPVSIHPLSMSAFLSCPPNRFNCTYFFCISYIYINIPYCFSLSDHIHSIWQTLGPSISLKIISFLSISISFLLMAGKYSIEYMYHIFSLYIT